MQDTQSILRPGGSRTVAMWLIALVVVVYGLKAAQVIVVPFLLAAFLAVVGAWPVAALRRAGLPNWLAVALVVLVMVAALAGVTTVVGTSIDDFVARAAWYQERLLGQLRTLLPELFVLPGDSAGEKPSLASRLRDQVAGSPGVAIGLAATLFTSISGLVGNLFLILFSVVFLLLEADPFSRKLHHVLGGRPATMEHFDRFAASLRRYLWLKTLISLATGMLIGAALHLLRVDFAVLLGLLAFLLNFVPNIGSIVASVPGIALALVQLGPGTALVVAIVYLAVNVTIGNLLEPRIMGEQLGLSTLVVFLSLVFWGFVLGPVGMLLSVPLTMTAKIALESIDETRWLGYLLGNRPHGAKPPPPS